MADVNTMDLFRLDNRIAVVTGGSKGLGRAMALGLAQAGATTVICSRHLEDCKGVAEAIGSETGQESIGVAVDVTKEADVGWLFETVLEEFGRVDARGSQT